MENPNFLEFSLTSMLDLWVFVQKWRISQFLGKIAPNVLSFQSILHIKCLSYVIFEENPEYSESLYQLTVYLAFCLDNILIFWNLLHQIQVITPKQSDFTDFSEYSTTIHIKNRTYENGFSTNGR